MIIEAKQASINNRQATLAQMVANRSATILQSSGPFRGIAYEPENNLVIYQQGWQVFFVHNFNPATDLAGLRGQLNQEEFDALSQATSSSLPQQPAVGPGVPESTPASGSSRPERVRGRTAGSGNTDRSDSEPTDGAVPEPVS